LDAQGDPRAVFIFQAESTLITATDSSVTLTNGAQACNVYWQVGSSATLGAGTAFKGTVMALSSISVNDGVPVDGRLLARNGAVTLINDTIIRSQCATGSDGDSSSGGATSDGATGGTGAAGTGGGSATTPGGGTEAGGTTGGRGGDADTGGTGGGQTTGAGADTDDATDRAKKTAHSTRPAGMAARMTRAPVSRGWGHPLHWP
jgi:hypothetical protein